MHSTTSGKPRLLFRCHVLRRESLPRQALPCSFVKEPFCRHYTESSRKALEKGDKRDLEKVRMEREELERQQREGWRRATDRGRLKLKLQSRRRTAAMDSNDDGRDGDELWTTKNGISRRTTYGVGKTRPFPMHYLPFPMHYLPFSTHYLPFPTHTYDVGKTLALGIPLIFHVRLFPTHYLRRRENLGLSRCTTYDVGKT
ncbi:Nuclear protein X1 isoform 3 [Cucumis melo var. makuwa]|uniref:Nuclear protein X1 isoform 3 n=1 Tax=Cucumis melo var. makuwa TaxID=1194695 RepID=A0A5A7UT91_CUCMM|nr:Nuclear protein X1 isoform 3 [Cucumis melo var. makuwa]TYK26883.1 Nuclear protein X1 isoform 3 [Cucumis melo var. makuwa]